MHSNDDRKQVKKDLSAIAKRVQNIRGSWSSKERSERAEAGQERRMDLYRMLLGLQSTAINN